MSSASKRWQKISKEVDGLHDSLGRPVDSGIKDLVVVLRILGYKTIGSCEGHIDHGTGGPWVTIMIDEAEELETRLRGERRSTSSRQWLKATKPVREIVDKHLLPLEKLLKDFYKTRQPKADLKIELYNPGGGLVILESRGLNTSIWQKLLEPKYNLRKLRAYQAEMQALTNFLKEQL